MKTPECQQFTLVEALRDGRLGPQERASMERHLVACAACSAFARDLERIGEALRAPRETATPLEHQRARLGLLRRAAGLGAEAAPLPRRFPVFAMAAALSFAAAIGWAGARVGAPEEQPLRALHQRLTPQLPALLHTSIRPSGGARYERSTTETTDVVTLTSGALDVSVRPLSSHERFVVKTSDAEIEVRGTSFHVEADQGRIRGVTVVEGSAELRYAGFSAVISQGGSWRATSDKQAANEAEDATAPSAAPAAPPSAPAFAPPVITEARVIDRAPAPRVATRTFTAPRRERPSAPPPPATASPTDLPEPPAPPAPSAAPRPLPTISPASREFADAMAALGKGDYLRSEKQLDAFAASHPGDARADEADYLRAIALQRAGKPAEAAQAARRYLTTHPRGAHRTEAQSIAGK